MNAAPTTPAAPFATAARSTSSRYRIRFTNTGYSFSTGWTVQRRSWLIFWDDLRTFTDPDEAAYFMRTAIEVERAP